MDSNQTLAAEPGFHSDAPRLGGFEVTAIRRISNHRSELAEQQPENGLENGLALPFGPAQSLRVVIKDGAGGAACLIRPSMRRTSPITKNSPRSPI
jgi:hypothetical protein